MYEQTLLRINNKKKNVQTNYNGNKSNNACIWANKKDVKKKTKQVNGQIITETRNNKACVILKTKKEYQK